MKKVLLLAAALFAASSANAELNEFHPEFPLLDAAGEPVMESGLPMSNLATCGGCHDAAFILESSDHAAAGVFGDKEIQCLDCHGNFTAPEDWSSLPFNEDGSLPVEVMEVHKPLDRNCANCHEVVNNRLDIPLTLTANPSKITMTDRTGQIFAAQKIVNSGLNVKGKNELTRPFDVHADRVVHCTNCHYSLNNPVYYQQREASRPTHLEFDPRRLTNAEYLQRPLHQLAKGSARDGLGAFESENSMRRCDSCHDATAVHQWLPYKQRHFESLACESCHVPEVYGPALKALDWTIVDADGNPRKEYRNVEGDPFSADGLISGFRPVIMARENVGGERKLAPFNLVTNWFWTHGETGERIEPGSLVSLFYADGALHADLDGDNALEAARKRIEAAGYDNVQLASEIEPYPVNHGVVNGEWAVRECRECHSEDSVLGAPVLLASSLPGGIVPVFAHDAGAGENGVIETAGGSAWFTPSTTGEGYYVLGLDNVPLVDVLGLLMFFGILGGVSVHGFLRFIAHRRWGVPERPTKRVKLYDAYDRIWHWLQAGAILMLLFTGLVIHKPHIFGMFSFRYVVEVHNVLGFILLINAALALFYTVASGTIKRFFPDPDGVFVRIFEQAMFYTRGIFAGEAHPLEKTPQDRLNPLQQVTYLAIINILLPAQVVTGFLIWGTQYWPQLTEMLGGLPVLGPAHTFLAWAFAAFIVMHIYLTTTGETPLSGIKAMVTGWEDVEIHDESKSTESKEVPHG